MIKESKVENRESGVRSYELNNLRHIAIFFVFIVVFCLLTSCSQPVLEPIQCIESRDSVKKLYSYHFGNDMKPSAENLVKREKYLSNNLKNELFKQTETTKDYFTQTTDYPKAFRVGKCETANENKTNFEVLLFWRTNDRSIQKEIEVEAVKENDKWLINKVTPKN